MGKKMFKVPEQYRLNDIPHFKISEKDEDYKQNGAFIVPCDGELLVVIASNGMDWEHVSVSHKDRCPTWGEMCFIKGLFWDDEDCVMQLHPKKSEYVNLHKTCLHLWRPMSQEIPQPPSFLVGLL